MMAEGKDWDSLVQDHLISTGLFSGITLLTDTAQCIYSYGQLQKTDTTTATSHQNWKPFVALFVDDTPAGAGLELEIDGKVTKFIVFKRSQSSVYATSEGKVYTLVVVSLPLALLLCVSKAPTPVSKTVTAAEAFCSILK